MVKLMTRYSFDQHDKAFVAMSCCGMGFVALNATKAIFLAFRIFTCKMDTNMVLALYPTANPHSSGNLMTALKTIHDM
jgi:predicted methyltransferase